MKTLLQNCRFSDTLINILVDGDRISRIFSDTPPADSIIDLQGNVILPGMIDLHTHIRDMGQSHKEDWTSASKAALNGGVTTIFDMPNTLPPTIDCESLRYKRGFAQKSRVNYGFHIAATPHNYRALETALREENPAGIKVFLSASSSNEVLDDPAALRALFLLARTYNKTVLVHSESQACIEAHSQKLAGIPTALDHADIRNRECAIHSTKMIIALARETRARVLLLHIATAEEIDMIRQYKKSGGDNVFCETTPHHLLLDGEALHSHGNVAKVNPPIRTRNDNQAILEGILDGTVDTIGSDHAPHSIEEKSRGYSEAPSGFPGLETTLPLLFHEVFSRKSFSLDLLSRLCSANPASILNIPKRGRIETGYAADLIAVDVSQKSAVRASEFSSKAKYSPFEGHPAQGKIIFTMVNGIIENHTGKEIHYD